MIAALDNLIQNSSSIGVQRNHHRHGPPWPSERAGEHLGKLPRDLFAEFEGRPAVELPSGDVKYHMGFSSDIPTANGPVHVSLAFNPRTWKSSTRWWKARCARASNAATTTSAVKWCRC